MHIAPVGQKKKDKSNTKVDSGQVSGVRRQDEACQVFKLQQGRFGRHPSNAARAQSWNNIGQEKIPSQSVSIRAIDPKRYRIIDLEKNDVIEEVEESFYQVYEGAVYINQGKTYLVKTLDLAANVALCQEADLKHYTKARDFTDVPVTGGELAYPRNISVDKYRSTTVVASTCDVTTRWIGFRRILAPLLLKC